MIKKPLLILCATLALSACQNINIAKNLQSPTGTFAVGSDKTTTERLQTIAKQAANDGNLNEARAHYENLYARDTQDISNALNYAQVLRKTGDAKRAAIVLAPFVTIKDKKNKEETTYTVKAKSADLQLEYAAALLESGQFNQSEIILKDLLQQKKDADLYPQAHQLIGISLDARQDYTAAATHYEAARNLWVGTPTSVMNNYAINLAHQGQFDTALNMLQQALITEPDNTRIATNIDFVKSLQKKAAPKPTPLKQ